MTAFLLKLLNISSTGNARVVGSEFVLGGGIHGAWILLLAIVLAAASVLLYRREEGLSTAKRFTLAALRAGTFLMLLLLIARPIVRFTLEGDIRKAVLLMLDNSASMSIVDPRSEDADKVRQAIAVGALDSKGGLKQSAPADAKDLSRIDLVRKALDNKKLDILPRLQKEYDLRIVSFGEQLFDVPVEKGQSIAAALEKVQPDRSTTAMGDGMRNAVSKSRGQPLAGIVLITDSANNAGSSPIAAAELATREGIPVYGWGVGITNPKDVAVASVFARDVGFIDDELPVVTRLRTSGLVGQTVKVVAMLNKEKVGEQDVKITADGEQLVQFPVTPTKAGTFNLEVKVDPLASEAVKDNNSQSQQVRVVDGKIKVLYVEQQPRWEYKYLQAMLLRDRRVAAKFVLLEGDKSLSQGGEKSPYLAQIPQTKEELFKFDLIIIGDVDPSAISKTQMEAMEQFVGQFGGAVVMISGHRFAPSRYGGTVLEKMMPVEWETGASPMGSGKTKNEQPIKFELTPAGKSSEVLRLGDDEQASAQIWEKLPPIYWAARVSRPKPAAEVLLVDADPAKATRFGKMPIIATQQYGLGSTMYFGTDNLWRWRKNASDKHYGRLWGQVVQRLALPHLLGESRRTQLVADKKSYSVGERMTVYARLYTQSYEPITEASVKGTLKKIDGAGSSIILRQVPGQPGMYRAEITAPMAGSYQFNVDSDPSTKLELPITEPRVEFAETAMNESLLRQVCQTSHGAFFREEDLHKLPEAISGKTDKVRSNVDVEIWSSPIFLLLVVVLTGVEWAMRKMAYLK